MPRLHSLASCLCVLTVLGCTRVTSDEENQRYMTQHMTKAGQEFMEYLDTQQTEWHESVMGAEVPSISPNPVTVDVDDTPAPAVVISSSAASSSMSSEASGHSSSEAPVVISQLYRNAEFAFSVEYIGGVVNESAGYIRMQNYDAAQDRFALTDKDYYLEISVVRPSTATENIIQCRNAYPQAAHVQAGAAVGYRTVIVKDGMHLSILCMERKDATLYFVVTDVSDGRYGQTILDSVKFRLP